MITLKSNSDFINSDEIVAISVGHSSNGMLHNKILYKLNNDIKEIHLGWHHCFIHTNITSPASYIWEAPKIPKARLRSVAAKCAIIAENQAKNVKNKLPYAIGYYSGREFDQKGIYTHPETSIEYGMTCATFVLTVFQSVGIQLIDWENWIYRKEDDKFFDYIIYHLEQGVIRGKIEEAHLQNVKKEKTCARFRPEEVFSSVYCGDNQSSLFICTSKFGEIVKEYAVKLIPEH